MITSLARVISPYFPYPEIVAANLINITLSSLSLIIVYLLTSPLISPFFAFSLALLVATNQINQLYSAGITNDVTYVFFLLFSLYLYLNTKGSFRYLFFGLLFLLRYESIVIPIAIFLVEYTNSRHLLKFKNICLSFIPILIWFLILHFHSRGNSLIDNAYIEEMMNGLTNIPNTLVYSSLIELITFDQNHTTLKYSLFFLIVIFGLLLRTLSIPRTKPVINIIYLIFTFHLTFLSLFPNFAIRYSLPIIWIVYFVIIYHPSRLITTTITLSLLVYNFARINLPSNYSHPSDMQEYRLLANWLNLTKFDRPTTVLIYESHILRYFVNNSSVHIPYDFETPFADCQDEVGCLPDKLSKNNNQVSDVLVVSTIYNQNQINYATDRFTAQLHHVNALDFNTIIKNPKFKHLNTLVLDDNWAQVFKYTP